MKVPILQDVDFSTPAHGVSEYSSRFLPFPPTQAPHDPPVIVKLPSCRNNNLVSFSRHIQSFAPTVLLTSVSVTFLGHMLKSETNQVLKKLSGFLLYPVSYQLPSSELSQIVPIFSTSITVVLGAAFICCFLCLHCGAQS